MKLRSRLAGIALLTAGTYLSAALYCAAPAAAQSADRDAEGSPAPPLPRAGEPRMPQSPPDVGGVLQEEPIDPATYVVGPNDLLALCFWGPISFNYRLRVDPAGHLFIPSAGSIKASGLTLAAVQRLVEAKVKPVYPRLKFFLYLLRPRTFLVQVTGLVQRPDAYAVSSLSRVSTIIREAGGRLPGGSQRHVEVRRNGKVIEADIFSYYANGDRSRNPQLVEGDVVYVPPTRFEVLIEGAVYRPGAYELTDDHTAGELVKLARGLTPDASGALPARLYRRDGDEMKTIELPAPRTSAFPKVPLRHGDRVLVPRVLEGQRAVVVQGAINAGRDALMAAGADKRVDTGASTTREVTVAVPYYNGDTVRTVLERAGGLLPWADARNTTLERRAGGKTTRIEIDAHALLVLRDVTHDVAVKPGDVVYVPAERDSVMVSGPVYRPGLYVYNPRFTAKDYIAMAGGPTPNGSVSGSKVVTRDGAKVPIDKANLVSPGDTVAVKQKALTTFEWVQILLTASSILLSATAIAITLRK